MDIQNSRVRRSSHKIELHNMTGLRKTFKFHFELLTSSYLALINHSLWKTYHFSLNIDPPNLILDWSWVALLWTFWFVFSLYQFCKSKMSKIFLSLLLYVWFHIFFSTNRCRPLKQQWNDENCTTTGYPWKGPIKEFVFL